MTSLNLNGGSLYIRDSGGVQYSTDNTSWTPISSWPVILTNTAGSSSILTVSFTTNITLSGTTQYFQCASSYIQFGNKYTYSYGGIPTITIAGVSGYPGLIQNGTGASASYNSIQVYNLRVITTGGSTLAINGGWIGQVGFGYFSNSTGILVIGCSSSGFINTAANQGGILGAYAGSATGSVQISGCYSTGAIGIGCGGIVGSAAGKIIIRQCFSTGSIGRDGGGIVGGDAGQGGITTITNCYSTGSIGGYAGGIAGAFATSSSGIVITGCYSSGNQTSTNAGGIIGASAQNITIQNCYTTGTISTAGGGIFGSSSSIESIAIHCYTTGTSSASPSGGIYAGSGTDNSKGANNFSEVNSGSAGSWSDSHASTYLQAAGWIQPNGINTPYLLRYLGYSPYSLQNISDASGNPFNDEESQTIEKGGSTTGSIPSGYTFSFLDSATGFSIDSSTGIITVDTSVVDGDYSLSVFAISSTYYVVVNFTITVPAPPAPESEVPGNQQINNYINIPSEMRYQIEQGQYMSTNASYTHVKQFGSYADYLRYRMANKIPGAM